MKKVARSRVCVVFPALELTVPPNGKKTTMSGCALHNLVAPAAVLLVSTELKGTTHLNFFWLRLFYDIDNR